jgi:hypothetical protein
MPRRALVAAATLAAVLSISGCFRHSYTYPDPPEDRAQVWQWHHHLLWGLVNISPSVHLERICPQGVARIENWMGPAQAIISYLTAGIYSPTTVRVFCAVSPQAAEAPVDVRVELDERTVARLREAFPDLDARVAALERDLQRVALLAAPPTR